MKLSLFKTKCRVAGAGGGQIPVAKFLVPAWGVYCIVDSLQHCVVVPACQPGQYDNPVPETTLSPPVRDYEFGYRRACAGWQIHQAPPTYMVRIKSLSNNPRGLLLRSCCD